MPEKAEVCSLSAGPLIVLPESGTFPNVVYSHKFQRKWQKLPLRWLVQTSLAVKITSNVSFWVGSIWMVWVLAF